MSRRVSTRVNPDSEDCRECGEQGAAPAGDRPFDGDNLCWDCHRDLYDEKTGDCK